MIALLTTFSIVAADPASGQVGVAVDLLKLGFLRRRSCSWDAAAQQALLDRMGWEI